MKSIHSPIYIPNEIMTNILSYIPNQVIKPKEYVIINQEEDEGYFGIITRLTKSKKFIVYDKFKRCNHYLGYYKIKEEVRSKIRKDKFKGNYIINNGLKYYINNKLPTLIQEVALLPNTISTMSKDQYRTLLKNHYYYYYDELPITIQD